MTAIGGFLVFGAVMACFAGTTLLNPGTPLDHLWVLNPRAYRDLAPFGNLVGIPFLLLAVALGLAAWGWFKRRIWGWRLAVAILAIQVLGDLVNVFLGRVLQGATGVAIAGALLFYILGPSVRGAFTSG
jgi:hypothetical protein